MTAQDIMTRNIKACEFYENAHNNHILFYEKILFIGILLGTIVVFINTVISTLITSGIGDVTGMNVTIAVISGLTGSAGIYITHYDPITKLSSHIELKNKYRNIINKIEWEQVFKDKSDEEINTFVKAICKEMIELEANNTSAFIFDKKLLNEQRILKQIKSPIVEKDVEANEINITGLTKQESNDYYILFNDSNMLQYQLQRLNG